jgi:hypothetical protein
MEYAFPLSTEETVRQFNQDADKAMAQIAEVHAKSSSAGR